MDKTKDKADEVKEAIVTVGAFYVYCPHCNESVSPRMNYDLGGRWMINDVRGGFRYTCWHCGGVFCIPRRFD